MQFLIRAFGSQQIEIRCDNFHRQPVSVESAVVQHHVLAGAHAIENGARSGHGAHRKTRAQSLAERADVGRDSVIFLASAGCVTKAGDNFIQDQQCTLVMCEFAQPLQISFPRRDAAHVGHDGLSDHCRQFAAVLLHDAFERGHVVPRCKHHIVEGGRRNAFGVRNPCRIFRRTQLTPPGGCAR